MLALKLLKAEMTCPSTDKPDTLTLAPTVSWSMYLNAYTCSRVYLSHFLLVDSITFNSFET